MKFRRLGTMIDCSRNAVMKPEKVKQWIDILASLGYNTLLLGRVIEDDDIIRDIKRVSPEDVRRVYGKYFRFDKMLFTAVGKVKGEGEYKKILEGVYGAGN